jgi:hypothetical protein
VTFNLHAFKIFRATADVKEVQIMESTTQFAETTEKVQVIVFSFFVV